MMTAAHILIILGTYGCLIGLAWLTIFCLPKQINPNESNEADRIQWFITTFLVVLFVGCVIFTSVVTWNWMT